MHGTQNVGALDALDYYGILSAPGSVSKLTQKNTTTAAHQSATEINSPKHNQRLTFSAFIDKNNLRNKNSTQNDVKLDDSG